MGVGISDEAMSGLLEGVAEGELEGLLLGEDEGSMLCFRDLDGLIDGTINGSNANMSL